VVRAHELCRYVLAKARGSDVTVNRPQCGRDYDKDFRQEAVNLLLSSELPSSMSLWSSPISAGQIRRPQREVEYLRRQREILSLNWSTGFFAGTDTKCRKGRSSPYVHPARSIWLLASLSVTLGTVCR
jgi:hypothetical protein